MKVTIYWVTRDWNLIRRIRGKYGLPQYMTLNGITEAEVDEETLAALNTGEPEYFSIRKTANCKQGKRRYGEPSRTARWTG